MMVKHRKLSVALLLASFFCAAAAFACTNLVLKGAPYASAIASARTVDFNIPINPKLLQVPRGLAWQSRGDDTDPRGGITWTNRYGFIALGASNEQNLYLDGINEAGLGAAILWLDETKYMPRQGVNDLSSFDLVSFIVGQYSTAQEARAALKALNVYGTFLSEYNMVIPLHLVVMDARGDSFVAEWIDGQLHIHDKSNTKGYIDVLANSPPYLGQLANLATYDDLSCVNTNDRYSLTGLPGNSASTSRFVRVAKLKQCAERVAGTGDYLIESEDEALERISQIIGRLDKVEGETVTEFAYGETLSFTRILVIRIHGKPDENGRSTSKFYFRTPDNQALRVIDLAKINFGDSGRSRKKEIKKYYVESPFYKKAQDAILIGY